VTILIQYRGFRRFWNILDIGKALFFTFLSNHRPSLGFDQLKTMTSGPPFVTLSSTAVHSSLESQSYTSMLFSTSKKWDRTRAPLLFHFKISEAGGISAKSNGPLHV